MGEIPLKAFNRAKDSDGYQFGMNCLLLRRVLGLKNCDSTRPNVAKDYDLGRIFAIAPSIACMNLWSHIHTRWGNLNFLL